MTLSPTADGAELKDNSRSTEDTMAGASEDRIAEAEEAKNDADNELSEDERASSKSSTKSRPDKPIESISSEAKKIAKKKTMKAILTNRQYRRRKMYKRSFKMLMETFEDSDITGSTDSSLESDDLLGSSDEERRQRKRDVKEGVVAFSMPLLEGEDQEIQEEEDDARTQLHEEEVLIYKTELYKYFKDGPSRKPQHSKTISGFISTEQERQEVKTSDAPFTVSSVYAISRDIDEHRTPSRIRVRSYIGDYVSIFSTEILEALREVMKFYPGQSPYSDSLIISSPYCVIVHHLEELEEYHKSHVPTKDAAQKAAIPGEPADHLGSFLNVVRRKVGDDLSAESVRNKQGTCTFPWVWRLYKPGSVVYAWREGILRAYIVQKHGVDDQSPLKWSPDKMRPPNVSSLDDLDSLHRPKPFSVTVWFLDFDGSALGRMVRDFVITPFEGEVAIKTLPLIPREYLTKDSRVHEQLSIEEALIQRGKDFCKLMRRSYKHYQGQNASQLEKGGLFFRRKVSGRVVVDTKYYYEVVNPAAPPALAINYDSRRNDDDAEPDMHVRKLNEEYAKWARIDYQKASNLPDKHYLVCNHTIWAFVLKTREWELLNVMDLQEPEFQSNLIDSLVLKPEAKSMIQALAKRYIASEQNVVNTRSADFISNKGEGHIFLLHGKPGVGKTSTAECVAEMTKRPLLSLTCGDLGLAPLEVEQALMKWMKLAAHWGAMLLLDEADVYLESRISQDLQRNSLVSVFLRAMEYFPGILFLTTNRVGTFDSGFLSRVHVIIHYPDFSNEERGKIWDNFFDRLERENSNFHISPRTIDYAKTDPVLLNLKWNGREIRNAFNTAVALAEHDNDRDAKGAIMMMPKHLEDVVKMSRSFQDYMKSTLGMDQAKMAKLYKVRDDNWTES